MKIIAVFIVSILFLTGCLPSISGVVKDNLTGSPIPSAIVNIGSRSATTDAIGHYRLSPAAPGSTLLINAPGYHIQTHSVKQQCEIIDIKLIPKK